jgi:CRISPR-associated protein Csm4
MKKSIIKLKFLTPLHVGNRNLSDSRYEIKSDTIFSALCLESGNIPKLVEQVREGRLKISDALPYIQDYYYIPKPMIHIIHQVDMFMLI